MEIRPAGERPPAVVALPVTLAGDVVDQLVFLLLLECEDGLEGTAGFQPVSFASTRELLEADILDNPGCLILDVRMPGASGLDLQQYLARSGKPKPIIFLTEHGDIPITVRR